MAEYERRISYFYRYQNGLKCENCGFCKVDIRGARLRVQIQLNDAYQMGEPNLRVFLYYYEARKMKVTELGNGTSKKGAFQFRKECNRSVLKQGTLETYSGILVYYSNQLFFASQWNEEPVDFAGHSLQEEDNNQAISSLEQSGMEVDAQEKETRSGLLSDSEVNDWNLIKKENISLQKSSCANDSTLDENRMLSAQEHSESGAEEIASSFADCMEHWNTFSWGKNKETAQKDHMDSNRMDAFLDEEVQAKALDSKTVHINDRDGEESAMRTEQWNKASGKKDTDTLTGIPFLLKNRQPLPAFANHEVMQCVRILPEDIGLMHRDNWEYGSNSFLLHGFYNYHYLLLGCMNYGDGKRQYVLGVPGIFSNKDNYLAEIFRFHEFIPLKTCPFRTGEFGYWIGKLKE